MTTTLFSPDVERSLVELERERRRLERALGLAGCVTLQELRFRLDLQLDPKGWIDAALASLAGGKVPWLLVPYAELPGPVRRQFCRR